MQKLITFLILVLIVVLVALVTIPQWAVKKPDQVLIGHLADVPNGWLYYGLDQELFAKYKIEPKLVEFFSYDEAFDSLSTGKIDCFFSFPWSFLLKKMDPGVEELTDSLEAVSDTLAQMSDSLTEMADTLPEVSDTLVEATGDTLTEPKVIFSFYSTPENPYGALIVPDDSKIKDMKDLRRKETGVPVYPHHELEVLFTRALEEVVPERYIRVEQVDRNEVHSLLEDEEILAALLYEPDLTRVLERDKTEVLADDPISTGVVNPYPVYAACITSSFLSERIEAAANLRTVFEECFESGTMNEAEMRASLTNYMRLTMSQSRKVRLPSFEKYEGVNPEAIQNFADILVDENILTDTIETQGILFEMLE